MQTTQTTFTGIEQMHFAPFRVVLPSSLYNSRTSYNPKPSKNTFNLPEQLNLERFGWFSMRNTLKMMRFARFLPGNPWPQSELNHLCAKPPKVCLRFIGECKTIQNQFSATHKTSFERFGGLSVQSLSQKIFHRSWKMQFCVVLPVRPGQR